MVVGGCGWLWVVVGVVYDILKVFGWVLALK